MIETSSLKYTLKQKISQCRNPYNEKLPDEPKILRLTETYLSNLYTLEDI